MTTLLGWLVALLVWLGGVAIVVAGWLLATGIVVWAHDGNSDDKLPKVHINHAQGHDEYQNWSSRKATSCCNDRDCSGLAESDVREDASGTQVLVMGEWCPVLREHFLIRGKSPDWNVSHACINKSPYWTAPNCERLLCYTGRGGF